MNPAGLSSKSIPLGATNSDMALLCHLSWSDGEGGASLQESETQVTLMHLHVLSETEAGSSQMASPLMASLKSYQEPFWFCLVNSRSGEAIALIANTSL